MAETDALNSNGLVIELKDAFLGGNGSPEEWEEITTRPELPTWAVHWMHGDDEERKDQLDELFQYYMVPFTLIEMEILDDHGISSGRALVWVIEAKVTASQHAAKVWFLASTETQFDDWANLHFNDLKDFDLHFCRRHPSGCKVKPRSSKLGWYHVGVFRLLTVAKAVEQDYMKEAVIEQLGDHLTAYMEEKEVSHREEVQALVEQRREEAVRTTSAKFKAKQKEDLEARTRRVPEEPKGSPPRKAVKLPKATEDQKKAERAEAARKARENADAAAKALSGGQPHMLEPPGVTRRERREKREEKVEDDRRAPGGGFSYGGRGGTFLDNISALGSDDPYGADQREKPPRGPGRGGPGGGGGGSPPKDRGQKRRRSSSSPKKPVRASKVIAPEMSRRKRKPGGDPSSDPDPSSEDGKKRKDDEPRKKKKKLRKDNESSSHSGEKKHGRRRKRRHKKKDKSSSSRSSRSSEDEIYGKETAKYESLMEKAKRHPGKLLRSGLEQMSRFMNTRSGDDLAPSVSWREQRVNAYLNQVLFNQHPASSMGMRNARELVTLATCIDLLMEEQFASLGDVLMQRLKVVEASLSEGWSVANFQELIPPPKATLTSDQERAFAARHALQQRKLADSVRKKSG